MLIWGMISRPWGTAREPDYMLTGRKKEMYTGGQKSFCMSTMMRAEVCGLKGGDMAWWWSGEKCGRERKITMFKEMYLTRIERIVRVGHHTTASHYDDEDKLWQKYATSTTSFSSKQNFGSPPPSPKSTPSPTPPIHQQTYHPSTYYRHPKVNTHITMQRDQCKDERFIFFSKHDEHVHHPLKRNSPKADTKNESVTPARKQTHTD